MAKFSFKNPFMFIVQATGFEQFHEHWLILEKQWDGFMKEKLFWIFFIAAWRTEAECCENIVIHPAGEIPSGVSVQGLKELSPVTQGT